jgi:hypothetical protein
MSLKITSRMMERRFVAFFAISSSAGSSLKRGGAPVE